MSNLFSIIITSSRMFSLKLEAGIRTHVTSFHYLDMLQLASLSHNSELIIYSNNFFYSTSNLTLLCVCVCVCVSVCVKWQNIWIFTHFYIEHCVFIYTDHLHTYVCVCVYIWITYLSMLLLVHITYNSHFDHSASTAYKPPLPPPSHTISLT